MSTNNRFDAYTDPLDDADARLAAAEAQAFANLAPNGIARARLGEYVTPTGGPRSTMQKRQVRETHEMLRISDLANAVGRLVVARAVVDQASSLIAQYPRGTPINENISKLLDHCAEIHGDMGTLITALAELECTARDELLSRTPYWCEPKDGSFVVLGPGRLQLATFAHETQALKYTGELNANV